MGNSADRLRAAGYTVIDDDAMTELREATDALEWLAAQTMDTGTPAAMRYIVGRLRQACGRLMN